MAVDLADVGTCDCACDERAVALRTENERLRASKQALVDKVKRLEDQVARLSPGFKP